MKRQFTAYIFTCPILGCGKEIGGPVALATMAKEDELERIKLIGLEYHARTKDPQHQCQDPEALLEWINDHQKQQE